MKFDFIDSAFDLSALSTCVLDSKLASYGSVNAINLNDDITATCIYLYSLDKKKNIENHKFSIIFYKDKDYLDSLSFSKTLQNRLVGSLARKDLDVNVKLEILDKYIKPSLFAKIKRLPKDSKLNKKEQLMIKMASIKKRQEVVNLLDENKNLSR